MFKVFIKRFLLIIIGIILSLIVLECGLRLAGWVISSYQQYKNNKALKNKSQYTIMCLGESTTADQYPVQLQEILDKKYPKNFSVIDCGIPGTDLKTILDLLDVNMNKYNPDIAICMMGINDGFVDYDNNYIKDINVSLKLYKLFLLLKIHIKDLINKYNLYAEEQLNNQINLAISEYRKSNFNISKQILENILKNSNNEVAYYYLSIIYYYHSPDENDNKKGYNMAIFAIENNFSVNRENFYEIVIEHNLLNHNIRKLREIIEILINDNSCKIEARLYEKIRNIITEEEDKLLLKRIPNNDRTKGLFAIKYIKNDIKKTIQYFDQAEEIRLQFPDIETYNLYKLIIKKLIDNNIKVICMQYPVRSILSLQNQLKDEQFYDKIIFISNEKLFKDALMNKNYYDLFQDQFAGDFGHCADLGNTLIAYNIVNNLENILDLKKN